MSLYDTEKKISGAKILNGNLSLITLEWHDEMILCYKAKVKIPSSIAKKFGIEGKPEYTELFPLISESGVTAIYFEEGLARRVNEYTPLYLGEFLTKTQREKLIEILKPFDNGGTWLHEKIYDKNDFLKIKKKLAPFFESV